MLNGIKKLRTYLFYDASFELLYIIIHRLLARSKIHNAAWIFLFITLHRYNVEFFTCAHMACIT